MSEPETAWVPNSEILRFDTGLIILVELAGMRSESFDITVQRKTLRIEGKRPRPFADPADGKASGNISFGFFVKTLEIPPEYDPFRAKAAYLNGFLRIDVPAVKSAGLSN